MSFSLFVLILFAFISCGKAPRDKKVVPSQAQTLDGQYWAQLFAVNDKVAASAGALLISKIGDEFTIEIKMKGLTQGFHAQYLHQGKNCPGFASDKNQDSYIDAVEMRETVGDIAFSFDSEITGNFPEDSYPSGKKYSYKKSGSYSLITSNAGLNDLPLEGNVIAIYGAAPGNLPTTVKLGPDEAQIPIACGVIGSGSDNSTSPSTTPTWDNDDSEERPTVRRRPRRRPGHELPEIKPPVEPNRPTTYRPWWRRLWDAVRGWWRSGNSGN